MIGSTIARGGAPRCAWTSDPRLEGTCLFYDGDVLYIFRPWWERATVAARRAVLEALVTGHGAGVRTWSRGHPQGLTAAMLRLAAVPAAAWEALARTGPGRPAA